MKFYLLGLFAGDGWFGSRGICIGTNSREFANQIDAIARKIYSKSKIKTRIYKDGHTIHIVSVWKKDVQEEFEKLLDTKRQKSKTFKLPSVNIEKKRQFIAGLFDAEASIYFWHGKPRIGFELHNEDAIRAVFSVLRNDDVKCYLSVCARGAFKIDITGTENVERFFRLYKTIKLSPLCTGKS